MEKFNKLGLLCVIAVLLVAGCGKKKCSTDKAGSDKSSSKKLASADNIPMLKEETENLLEDTDIADFAFVDDEANKSADAATVAKNEPIEFADETTDDKAAAFAFKAVHFDFNKNSIRADQKQVVEEDLKVAKQAVETGRAVVVEGHCDQLGSASYNIALSQRRAEAIKQEFVQNGLEKDQVKTVGYGFERPIVWSDAQERAALIKELAPNRRAEVIVN